MEITNVQSILDRFADLANPPTLEGKQQWVEFLLEQDYNVAEMAALKYQRESGSSYWPSISKFNELIKARQRDISLRQAQMAKERGCKKCNGVTWVKEPDGVVPCQDCRATTYSNWEKGKFELSSPIDIYDNGSYPFSTPPVTDNIRASRCSPERNKQWLTFLSTATSPGFPEGDYIDDLEI